MATATSTKLSAKIIASDDVGALFPAPALQGLVAFDISVDKGEVATGKRIILAGPSGNEELTIKGIEMKSDPADPKKVRILCAKPTTIKLPLRDGAWVIHEA